MEDIIEARIYDENSTPEEVKAIKERIYLLEEDIIMYREMPVQSVFHIDIFEKRLHEIVEKNREYGLLIDIIHVNRPNAEIRDRLRKMFSGLRDNVFHAAAVTGNNFLLSVATQFVLARFDLRAVSVHKSRESALKALRSAKKK